MILVIIINVIITVEIVIVNNIINIDEDTPRKLSPQEKSAPGYLSEGIVFSSVGGALPGEVSTPARVPQRGSFFCSPVG